MQDISPGDLEQNLSTFEAAVSAKRTELPVAEVRRVLIAIDGSDQDRATVQAAAELVARTGARPHMIFAHRAGLDAQREAHLREIASQAQAEIAGSGKGDPWGQILRAAGEVEADVIVMCAPYLEDYGELAEATAGTTVDMVLSRRKQSLLVVREPREDIGGAFRHMVAPLRLGDWRTPRAGGWATSLARPGDAVTLVAVADEDFMQALADVAGRGVTLEEVDDDRVAGLMRPDIAGLVAAIQRRAAERDFECRVVVRPGSAVQAVARHANEERGLIVASCPGDCAATGYAQIQGLVRAARAPVLIV